MFEYPKTLSSGEFFSSWKGMGLFYKQVAAKVIHQHMCFFT